MDIIDLMMTSSSVQIVGLLQALLYTYIVLADKAGLKWIRIHDFRHSCTSLLVNNGTNITVIAKYLGYTKIEETLNTYTHLFNSALSEIVNLINRLDEK